ncbi:putative spermidine/putrescine transport system permease protein [Bradyrhizobium sp. CIR48]|uniref:ABC transporter permease subunit n=1 Tax=Bradyrhizobium sp. CIR48 TaxID=2663840 RepID=UPI00160684AC|nr:ABC transporter permease subunit [Bradyrhizobium sp. CIR48]MBB4423883.1 putative spermidine/putrescine transport system permease protein [Bradyrhizobium sp. CIR48]
MKTLLKLRRMPIVFTAPAVAMLLAVFGMPIVELFMASLNAPSLSLANYQAFFAQWANVRVLVQTVEISAVATALCLIIGYPTAYLIVAAPKRLRIVLMVLVFMPWLTNGLVRTYAWVVILGDRGLINNLLIDLGLISSPLSLIYNRMAIYIGMVHIMLPMMILPLISVMLGIDRSLVAAAGSMGARPFAAFWRVFLPLSLPGVRSGSLLVFIFCLGFYITPQALGGLGDAMLSTFIAAKVAAAGSLASIAASSFVLLAVAVAVLSMVGLDLSGKQGLAGQPAQTFQRGRLPSLGPLARYLNELATCYRVKRWRAQLYRADGGSRSWAIFGVVWVVLAMFFLQFPGLIVIITSFSPEPYLEFPPSGLSLRWYYSFFGDPSWTGAFWNSVQLGIAVSILATIIGTLAAYGLSRTHPRLRVFLTMLILTPITFPGIVVGVAIYLGLIKLGLIGTELGLILSHTVGAIGTVVVIVSATLANFDRRLEQAAQSMRAGPLRTIMRVTLPLIRPAIVGSAVFAFIHSFDEVVVTSLVSAFSIRTLPLKMWEDIRHQLDPTIAAVGSMLTVLPVLWLIVLYLGWWRSRSKSQSALVRGVP